MKASFAVAAAAAMVGGVSASVHNRHAHDIFHGLEKKGHAENATCVPACTTIYSVIYGEETGMTDAHNNSMASLKCN
jgi:hypothetical protein